MRHNCPIEGWADKWIETPDEWIGLHANRYGEATEKGRGRYYGVVADFAGYLALLDNWDLPGLTGPPDKWDILKMPLPVIIWVNGVVRPLFGANFIIPKASLPHSPPVGQTETTATAATTAAAHTASGEM